MDKRRSSSFSTTSPKDIPVRIIDDEIIPSRSYYSAHLHVDSNEPPKYSASIESIRAHSLALGDQYMTGSQPSSPSDSSNDDNRFTMNNNPILPAKHLQQPAESILSALLKQSEEEGDERRPLIIKRHPSKDYASTVTVERTNEHEAPVLMDEERGDMQHPPKKTSRYPKDWLHCITQPIQYIPAVILGLLLNLLDAISYGMITFPLNNPIFATFGPDGISMFFVR
ncbi:Putative Sulfate transporter family protein [Rhizopus microsporus]|nr:Putative Sulfate transporter family protein [Rhizopus microsporus]